VIWALVDPAYHSISLAGGLQCYRLSCIQKLYKANTEIYLFKQVAFIMVGIMVIYFAHLVNYTFYSKAAQRLPS
jgi:cell division protein FtsW